MPAANNMTLMRTLSDLLQLDHDALGSYTVAIEALSDEALKRQLRLFRRDHQRHVREISGLIEREGGKPLEAPHASTGFLKLAVQSLGAAGGDRAVLLAFRANEWEAAQKYARAARRRFSPEVSDVIRRGASDERRHYRWAVETLAALGADDRTVVGRIEQVLERLNGGMAMGLEALEQLAVGMVTTRRGAQPAGRARGKSA